MTKDRIKNVIIIVLAIAVILLLNHIYSYNVGVKGKYSLHGTYELITDNPAKQLYLSIDEQENHFWHLKHSDKLLQSGALETGEVCTLREEDTDIVYGRIIKSYNKIYFIDKSLDVSVYEKLWDVLSVPS